MSPTEVSRNDYGNDTTAYVAIPSKAGKRTWYKRETQERTIVEVEESVEGELGQVDLVDARQPAFTPPYDLVYDVPYET